MIPEIKKILFPTDLSENAQLALSYAMDLAEKYDAELTLLYVVPDIVEEMTASTGFDFAEYFGKTQLDPFSKEGFIKAEEAIKAHILKACDKVKNSMAHCPLDLNHVIIQKGHPVQQIVETATNENADIVVMGTQGQSGLIDILMGSVALGVVQKCPKPVLTVRLAD
ncbi:MAG: universal stress protein [Thermodesulfobacteriota bacterium]